VKAGSRREKKIVINHTGRECAADIRLKLLKLVSCGTKERTSIYGEREAEQYRNICQDKQGR
jgi:hypothetical protein